ncbi:MAG TPA: hypothetical protein PLC90_13600 [Bacteroidales bacterium]|nr:hypothetical protein [Bacteroidales bacterium]HPB26558.1 hypothetical protein [Bacteroidales bacterium]HPI31232.1 hypothetical protein [Bacteroidales bacterium]HQN17374.1 hypothetical protein [Bacteroidales bacterium]
MKNLDLVSKRILIVALSICAILLSASLLLLSISTVEKANAGPVTTIPQQEPNYRLYPMGMGEGYIYYIYDGGGAWSFEKIDAAKAGNAEWVK